MSFTDSNRNLHNFFITLSYFIALTTSPPSGQSGSPSWLPQLNRGNPEKKELSYRQERFLIYFVVLPIFSFFIPLEDLLRLTTGTMRAGIIISLAKSRK